MASNPQLQLKRFIESLIKLTGKDITSHKILTLAGKEMVTRVRNRTRLGYGVQENEKEKEKLISMRRHSQRYALWRKKNKDSLSPLTSPTKHNLTLTGHMLDNLKVTSVNASRKSVRIGFTNRFAKIKAEVNQDRGWRFLFLSKPEINGLTNFYKRELRKLVRANKTR